MASRNFTTLTRAELSVMRVILAGHTTAEQMHAVLRQVYDPSQPMSKRTIQTHLANIYDKTGAENKAELILMAQGSKPCAIDLFGQLQDAPAQDKSRTR